MKTLNISKLLLSLIAFIVIYFSTPMLFAQEFGVPFEISQGFQFKDYHHPQFYSTYASLDPTYSTIDGKLRISAMLLTVFCDGTVDYFIGSRAAYRVYMPKDSSFNIQLTVSALAGHNNKQLYGGGVIVQKGPFYLTANARQEYQERKFWFDAGIGVDIIHF